MASSVPDILLYLPFTPYPHSFLLTRRKDSDEGDAMKLVSFGIAFDPSKSDALTPWVCSSPFLNLSSSLSQEKAKVICPCTPQYTSVTRQLLKKAYIAKQRNCKSVEL